MDTTTHWSETRDGINALNSWHRYTNRLAAIVDEATSEGIIGAVSAITNSDPDPISRTMEKARRLSNIVHELEA